MKLKDMVDEAVNSGVAPLQLSYDVIEYFESRKTIVRTSLQIVSLELGVLTAAQYRYVARRNKRGDALTERHIKKLFEAYPDIVRARPDTECVTFSVYARSLINGSVVDWMYAAFAHYPNVSPSRVCVEVSADILYEDVAAARKQLDDLRAIGVKVAIFEAGDEFCPVFRLTELNFDYAFADAYTANKLESEETEQSAASLPRFLHLSGISVFLPHLEGEEQIARAKAAEFDGYGSSVALLTLEREEDDEDAT